MKKLTKSLSVSPERETQRVETRKAETIAQEMESIGQSSAYVQQPHPSIMLKKSNREEIRKGLALYPLLKKSYTAVEKVANKALSRVNVPTPKDSGGGETHEMHKQNYQNILACGIVYAIMQEAKYAEYVQTILLEYAEQYSRWPVHPKRKEGHPIGKIFWQNLNECVWLVYVIQGYDLVYDYISPLIRKKIEENLFHPIVELLTVNEYKTFNRIHNHATWSCAAVGMAGYVLGKPDWVEMALQGSTKDEQSGFLKQLEKLFSPDGYYAEGPYYQRYALLPFVLFAKAIQQYQPELKIYEFRQGVLKKAIHTALQLTATNSVFFPINDAMKDKTYECEEMVYAVDIAYELGAESDLLDIALKQNRVIVSDAGLKVAAAIAANKTTPFQYKSKWISDGVKGDEGGLGILRAGENEDQQCIVLKATAQGMDHGHFDRLNLLYYDKGVEILSDYGAVRFLNIDSKGGGNYLAENSLFAKQTIAHNTIVVDGTSHYDGQLQAASAYHPDLIYFSSRPNLQIVSAREDHAYNGISLTRTTALITVSGVNKPLLIDVMKATSNHHHQYDLPFWYQGSLVNIPVKVEGKFNELKPLGESNGYQFLWLNGTYHFSNDSSSFLTILNNKRFYTFSFTTDSNTSVKFVTVGANDPNFNLRNEKAFILTHSNSGSQTFISITEAHGKTDPIAETTTGAAHNITNIKIISDSAEQTAFTFEAKKKVHTVTLNYASKTNFITFFADQKAPRQSTHIPESAVSSPQIDTALR
jgi:hypothetical protein